MLLWINKYQPKTFDDLSFNENITTQLKTLSLGGDFPHLLMFGASGCGKKTRINLALESIFGPKIHNIKINVKTFNSTSSKKIEFNLLSSPFHFEITPSDLGLNDKIVIQELIKEVAMMESIDKISSENVKQNNFKVVIINEAEFLSRDAQAALRRTMEKYLANVRIVLMCNSISNIIGPLRSRTLVLRVPCPSDNDICKILNNISRKENVKFDTQDSDQIFFFLKRLAVSCKGNLRRALLNFETITIQNDVILVNEDYDSFCLDWELIIKNLSQKIKLNRSVPIIGKIRVVLYDLLSHCIPPKIILETLTVNLIDLLNNNSLIAKILETSSIFDERLSLGEKSIFHLEGFVIKSMLIIEEFTV